MGETWVLLRGLVREGRHWEGFPRLLEDYRPGARVVTPDLPGNGTRHEEPSPTRVPEMVEALRADLARQGLRPPWHVMALSLGGMVVVDWLARYPEELAAVVVINTSAGGFNPFWQRLQPGAWWPILRHGLLGHDPVGRESMILGLSTNLLGRHRRDILAERWAEYARGTPTRRENSLRQLLAASRFRAPQRLPNGVPLLLVNGAGDRLVSPRCSISLAAAWHCRLRVHPRAGHDLALDAPEWLARTVNEWMAEM